MVKKKGGEHTPSIPAMSRRTMISATAAAGIVLSPIGAQSQSQRPDPTLAEWQSTLEQPDIIQGPPSSDIDSTIGSINELEKRYRDAVAAKPLLTDEERQPFLREMYLLAERQGSLRKQYEHDHPRNTPPGLLSSKLASKFEADVRKVEGNTRLTKEQRSAQILRFFTTYLADVNTLNIYRIDEHMTNAWVGGYYCGYLDICYGGI